MNVVSRIQFLFLFLFCALRAYALPVEFNACDTDVDCEPSNAICYDGFGPTDQRRCMCQWGYLWDAVNHRCDLPHPEAVTVTRTSPLYYQEQTNDSVVGTLQFTRGRAVLPSTWFCDPSTQFCMSLDLALGVQVANFNYSLIANSSSDSSAGAVPGVTQYWRCTNRTTTRPTLFNDNMIVNATAVGLGFGQRPLWEYCPPCPTWCQRGTCSVDNTTCVCDAGWFGPLCDQQTTLANAASPWDANRACTFANETTACGVNEQCYIDAHGGGSGGAARAVCWCRIGFIPSTAMTTGCITASVATTASVLVDFVPNAADWRSFNATYAVSFPQYAWAQDQTTLYALLTSATTTPTNPAWRLNSTLRLLERCLSLSDFMFRPEFYGSPSAPVIVSRSRHRWCGFGGCSGVCGGAGDCGATSAADRFAGNCRCAAFATGQYCDTCVGDATGPACNVSRAACRASSCAGRGECVDAAALGVCRCDRPYLSDTACAVSARDCGQTRCSGHGECLDANPVGVGACVCDSDWDGAFCNVTAAACRASRCAGGGNCTTDVQGCTCDAFRLLSNCSDTYCAYGQPAAATAGSCACNASFVGAHCETRKCGMYGDATGPAGACVCFGVMARDASTGNCTAHICGRRGYPVAGRLCTCFRGNRLVSTDRTCQCQKPCSTHGRYDVPTDTCLCDPGFTGDLCELQIYTLLPVPRQWASLAQWLVVNVMAFIIFVNALVVHLGTDVYHTATLPPRALRFMRG